MRIRDLAEWPPKPTGPFRDAHKKPSSEQALIKRVVYSRNDWIIFSCECDGEEFGYDFEARDEEQIGQLKRVLQENVGQSLFAIRDLELPNSPLPS